MNTDEKLLKEIVSLAIKTAKRTDIPVSSSYDISREMWRLYWRYRDQIT